MPKLMFCNKCGKVSLDGKDGDKCYWCKKGHFFDSGINYNEARKIVEKDYHISLGDYSMEQEEEFLRKRFFYNSSFNDSEQKLVNQRMAYDDAYQQKSMMIILLNVQSVEVLISEKLLQLERFSK